MIAEDKRKEEAREILKELKVEVAKALQGEFVDMILFGSYSRGTPSVFSDIDVLILVKDGLSKEKKEKIDDLIARHSLKHDLVISCLIYPLRIFEEYSTPFLLNVKEEGIRI